MIEIFITKSLSFQDVHTSENDTLISPDEQQDCLDFNAKLIPNGVTFTFTRKFDTCDPLDYILEVKLFTCIL